MFRSLSGRVCAVVVAVLVTVVSSPVMLGEEGRDASPAELQQAIYDALVAIEKAKGLDSAASEAFYWYDADIQKALEVIPDKQGFLQALTAIKHRSMAARLGNANARILVPPSHGSRSLNGTEPFSPNYPDPYYDTDFQMLLLLGLAPDLYKRCDGETYAYYQAALYGASISLRAAQMACNVAGCDPTGVVCVSVCGATEAVNALYTALLEPVEYCESWAAKLDAAENEASYKNSESILLDLDAHDTRIVSLLAAQTGATDDIKAALAAHDLLIKSTLDALDTVVDAHDAHLTQHDGRLAQHDASLTQHDGRLAQHDADIKAMLAQMLATVVANQQEIIKLLKTPEGRRPGWGKEGY